jgi:hypothetical protein
LYLCEIHEKQPGTMAYGVGYGTSRTPHASMIIKRTTDKIFFLPLMGERDIKTAMI